MFLDLSPLKQVDSFNYSGMLFLTLMKSSWLEEQQKVNILFHDWYKALSDNILSIKQAKICVSLERWRKGIFSHMITFKTLLLFTEF